MRPAPDPARFHPVPSFTTVTELPGAGATREQISMLYTRYRWATGLSEGRDVLEVACGPGVGLGYLARNARRVVGGDFDEALVQQAQAHYRSAIPLLRLDAQALPFADRTFDLVLLFEAVYYLARPDRFFREARRVLRPAGVVLACLPNRDWAGFHPSPFAHHYPPAHELREMLSAAGFAPRLYGAFPAAPEALQDRILLAVRRAAVSMHLVPGTMKGKELVKRLVYRKLVPLPPEIGDGMASPGELRPVDIAVPTSVFKVLYIKGRAPG